MRSTPRVPDWVLLIALCLIGFALGQVQNAARSAGRVDPITDGFQAAVSPISRTLSGSLESAGEFLAGLGKARPLAIENQRLYDRLVASNLYTERTERLTREVESLRGLLNLPARPGRRRIVADVIAFVPRDSRFALNVGRREGVEPGMPVVSAAGLVGIVQNVSDRRCQVLLATSRSVKLGALILNRNPAPVGLLQGETPTSMSIVFQDPKAPVQVGDVAVTSGFSEKIPPGIVIGRVIQVDEDAAFGERRAIVDAAVSLGEVGSVVVLG